MVLTQHFGTETGQILISLSCYLEDIEFVPTVTTGPGSSSSTFSRAKAGQCLAMAQFSSSLSGAGQALMSMHSGGQASHRGPISLVGSAAGTPQAPVCLGLMDYPLSWLRSGKARASATGPICVLTGLYSDQTHRLLMPSTLLQPTG